MNLQSTSSHFSRELEALKVSLRNEGSRIDDIGTRLAVERYKKEPPAGSEFEKTYAKAGFTVPEVQPSEISQREPIIRDLETIKRHLGRTVRLLRENPEVKKAHRAFMEMPEAQRKKSIDLTQQVRLWHAFSKK